MKVSDLLKNLSYGELSNLSMSGEGSGTIVDAKIPTVLVHANEALLRLYSRFNLKENSVIIQQVGHVTQYHLSSDYAQSKQGISNKPHLYIVDSLVPYTDDAIRIQTVFNQYGCQLPLNDSRRIDSLFTIQPLVLQVPNPVTGEGLAVTYQAKHPLLVPAELNAEIELPDTLHGALRAFIAHEIYSNMNGTENTAMGQKHLANYNKICQEVEDNDVVLNTISETNTKLTERGFV